MLDLCNCVSLEQLVSRHDRSRIEFRLVISVNCFICVICFYFCLQYYKKDVSRFMVCLLSINFVLKMIGLK